MAKISVDLEGGPGSDGPSEKVREPDLSFGVINAVGSVFVAFR